MHIVDGVDKVDAFAGVLHSFLAGKSCGLSIRSQAVIRFDGKNGARRWRLLRVEIVSVSVEKMTLAQVVQVGDGKMRQDREIAHPLRCNEFSAGSITSRVSGTTICLSVVSEIGQLVRISASRSVLSRFEGNPRWPSETVRSNYFPRLRAATGPPNASDCGVDRPVVSASKRFTSILSHFPAARRQNRASIARARVHRPQLLRVERNLEVGGPRSRLAKGAKQLQSRGTVDSTSAAHQRVIIRQIPDSAASRRSDSSLESLPPFRLMSRWTWLRVVRGSGEW